MIAQPIKEAKNRKPNAKNKIEKKANGKHVKSRKHVSDQNTMKVQHETHNPNKHDKG